MLRALQMRAQRQRFGYDPVSECAPAQPTKPATTQHSRSNDLLEVLINQIQYGGPMDLEIKREQVLNFLFEKTDPQHECQTFEYIKDEVCQLVMYDEGFDEFYADLQRYAKFIPKMTG